MSGNERATGDEIAGFITTVDECALSLVPYNYDGRGSCISLQFLVAG